MKRILVFVAFCGLTISASAQAGGDVWKKRVAPIVAGASTDYEKARAIYDWEVKNILYDYTFKVKDGETAWIGHKGVCYAFCDIYVSLATACGLEAVTIGGVGRNGMKSDGKAIHNWVRVKTERGWIFVDPTWGSCNSHADRGSNGGKYAEYSRQAEMWFDIDPQWLIFTHFPNDPEEQHLETPLTEQQYMGLPYITPEAGFLGWDAGKMLRYFLNNPGVKGPQICAVPNAMRGKLQLVEVPFRLKAGQKYTIKVRSQLPLGDEWKPVGDTGVYAWTFTAQAGKSYPIYLFDGNRGTAVVILQ